MKCNTEANRFKTTFSNNMAEMSNCETQQLTVLRP